MAGRKTVLLGSALTVYTSTAAAQMLGAEMTVEESLVEFVNTVTTFQVETAGEVMLFIVMPIIGFYFLIKNFTTMGYETFEERIGRENYHRTDEDTPTGMKGFSLVASSTTVLTLGAISSGLLALAGLSALALAAILYAGLIPSRTTTTTATPTDQTTTQDSTSQNGQTQNHQNLQAWKDLGKELGKTGREIADGYSQRSRQREEKGLEEALRFFDTDMVSEIEHVRKHHSSIERLLSQAEDDLGDFNDNGPDVFKSLTRRAGLINEILGQYTSKSPATIDNFHNSVKSDRNFKEEIYNLENQIKRCLKSESITPPDDVFNDLLDEMQFILASAHFMHYSPVSMSEISSDRDAAEKVVSKALDMNKCQDLSGRDEANELMRVAGWLDQRSNTLKNIVKRAERIAKMDMQISEAELNHIKKLVEKDGEIHSKLKALKNVCSSSSVVSTALSNDILRAEAKMADVDTELASLESKVAAHGKFESDVYKQLKKLEQAM